nr:ribosomal protein L4 [Cryptomonas borealis]
MRLIKQLNYDLQSLENNETKKSPSAIQLHVNATTPKYLIHKCLVIQDENARQGSASSKTRTEVRGGGKKPWKQKGTGRARAGSSNSPLWRGGGVSFGPKPKIYKKKINLKEKQLGLLTALYHVSDRLFVLKNNFPTMDKPNTKEWLSFLNKFEGLSSNQKILVILPKMDKVVSLSTRNIPNIHLAYINTLNLRNLLLATQIVLTEKTLLQVISPN